MRFDILTLFPELLHSPLQESIVHRARQAGHIQVALHNIRDWTTDRHNTADDRPFGGGEGMVMKAGPLAACLEEIQGEQPGRVILLTPRGRQYDQQQAKRLSGYDRLILVCGRYEGVDERFTRAHVDEEISIGDYILTGGELAAMVLVDSITRLLPGVLGCARSASEDTFSHGLLKHPQYTRPREFAGMGVPEVLLSGDHARIAAYRFCESVRLTLERRPDLLQKKNFSRAQQRLLQQAGLWPAVQDAMAGKQQ